MQLGWASVKKMTMCKVLQGKRPREASILFPLKSTKCSEERCWAPVKREKWCDVRQLTGLYTLRIFGPITAWESNKKKKENQTHKKKREKIYKRAQQLWRQ